MHEIEVFEENLKNEDGTVAGKVAILRGGLHSENPTKLMNDAVSKYVGDKPHNQFVEIHLDNLWVRVLISGINALEYGKLENKKIDENI